MLTGDSWSFRYHSAYFGFSAGPVIGDDVGMGFEEPVSVVDHPLRRRRKITLSEKIRVA